MHIRIEIDYRERASGIADILRKRCGVTVEEKRLSIGDYLVNEHIAIEKKDDKGFYHLHNRWKTFLTGIKIEEVC